MLYSPRIGGSERVTMDDEARDRLIGQVVPLAELFVARGHRVYLVGGIVRDLLLGRQRDAPDIDLTTDALPQETLAILTAYADSAWEQGLRFGTVGCRVGHQIYEVTTHRSETYVSDSRKPAVKYSQDVVEDLSRRDFTVNALAIELPGGSLIDPYGGQEDLQRRVLRTPLTAEISFEDDPLRMLRAARFVAGYQLTPTVVLEQTIERLRARMSIVSRERVRSELDRLLLVDRPRAGLELIARTRLMYEIAPELAELSPQQWEATVSLVDTLPELELRRSALYLFVPRSKVEQRLRSLKYSNDETRATVAALRAYDLAAGIDAVDAPTLRRFVHQSGNGFDSGIELLRQVARGRADALERALVALRQTEDLSALGPELDGDEIQALLSLPPGPIVGEALGLLTELRIAQGAIGKEAAGAQLLEWYRRR